MIDLEVKWIDITPYLLTGEQPVYVMPRPKAHNQPKAWAGSSQVSCIGDFWVVQGPLIDNSEWTLTKTGDFVRIPVFAFKVNRALASIWGLGIQIGMLAITELRNYTNDIPQSVILILGHDCTDLSPAEEAFRCYVGIAIRTK